MLWAAIAAFSKPHEPAWRGLERLIEHAREEWQRSVGAGSVGYRPFHTGFRFSANARGPSTTSSLVQSFRTRE